MKKQLQQARNLADTQTRRTPTTFGQGVVAKEYTGTTAQASNTIVLENVRIVEEGEAKGHGVWMDSSFIQNVVEFGNASGTGIKCRFDHMTHCMTTMGWLLGRFKNFKLNKDEIGRAYATADLHLLNAAHSSPHGDIATYISLLAKEAPEFFGTSIEFKTGPSYFKTDKNVNVFGLRKPEYSEKHIGIPLLADGSNYSEEEHGVIDYKKQFETIKSLHGADIVDTPAATNSLFGSESVFDNVMLSLGKVFGVDIAGKRKTATIRKAFNEIVNMSKKKFDINSKTSAGVDIIIATDNDYIGIGDAVVLPDGSPAPDGEHAITESDSGQTGITITLSGGTVTRIDATPAASAETAPMSEGEGESSQELSALSKAVNNLNTMFQALSAEAKSLKEAQVKMNQKLLLLDSKPDGKSSDIVERKLGTRNEDNGFVWLR